MFIVEVPRKRQRNSLKLAQAMGLTLTPSRLEPDKRRKRAKHRKRQQAEWEES